MVKKFSWISILILLILSLLSACQGTNSNGSLDNVTQIKLTFNPATKGLLNTLEICDMSIPDFEYITYFSENSKETAYFHYGEPNGDLSSLIPITYDDIAIIVNPNNLVNNLSLSEIRSIFSGRINSWQSFNNSSNSIQVYLYAYDSELQIAFERYVMQNQSLSMTAELVPSIQEMRIKINENPNAIGFLPKSLATDLEKTFIANVHIPILVSKGTKTPYADDRVLACLQSETMQIILLQKYSATIQ